MEHPVEIVGNLEVSSDVENQSSKGSESENQILQSSMDLLSLSPADDPSLSRHKHQKVKPIIKLDWNSGTIDNGGRVSPSKDPDHKRQMLDLIQKEMDDARQRLEVDEFGDFRCSRYGKKPTLVEDRLGSPRYGYNQLTPNRRNLRGGFSSSSFNAGTFGNENMRRMFASTQSIALTKFGPRFTPYNRAFTSSTYGSTPFPTPNVPYYESPFRAPVRYDQGLLSSFNNSCKPRGRVTFNESRNTFHPNEEMN